MRKNTVILLPLIFSVFLAGCGQGYVSTPPATIYKRSFASAIKEKRVTSGMNMKQVLESWGDPIKTEDIQIKNRYYTVWAYNRDNSIILLYFYKGAVKYIQE